MNDTNCRYTIFSTMAAFTGLRCSELLGLGWKNIDLENDLFSIDRMSEYIKKNGIYTGTPKTENSVRLIKLPPK